MMLKAFARHPFIAPESCIPDSSVTGYSKASKETKD
jgi:hypothetical protein